MSYDDGDISMASIKGDESFNMSVDEGVDIVWHSTQLPALQTMLEESKTHQRYGSPMTLDQTSIFGSGTSTTKPLFKKPSLSPVTAVPPSITQDPAELRKMRPSQRRAYTQASATQKQGPAAPSESSQNPSPSNTEKLESLREMINSVGQSWSRERQISHPGRLERASTSDLKIGERYSSMMDLSTTPYSTASQAGAESSKPKVATTIKPLKPFQGQLSNTVQRNSSSVGKGKMLPPALPSHQKPESSDKRAIERRDDISAVAIERERKVLFEKGTAQDSPCLQMDLSFEENPPDSEPPSPSPTNSEYSTIVLNGSRSKIPARAELVAFSQNSSQPQNQYVGASKSQPKKALGMRRTTSLNYQGTPASQSSTAAPTKAVSTKQASQRTFQRTNSMEHCSTQKARKPLLPSLETASRARTFKVPWAGATAVDRTNSVATWGRDSPTTATSASQSSGSGSDSAHTSAGESNMSGTANPNPDSSYSFSFDEGDLEELNAILSQAGA